LTVRAPVFSVRSNSRFEPMSARRILFVEASTGGVVGGSLTGILHLIPRLDRARFAPVLSLFEDKGVDTDGLPVHVLPPLPRRGAAASPGVIPRALRHAGNLYAALGSRARALAKLYRRERPDLVYLSNGFGAQLDGVVAAKLCRLPVVCHEKGFESFGPLARLLSRWVDACICMTEEIEAHCREQHLRPRRLRTIFDGIDCAPSRPGVEGRYGASSAFRPTCRWSASSDTSRTGRASISSSMRSRARGGIFLRCAVSSWGRASSRRRVRDAFTGAYRRLDLTGKSS